MDYQTATAERERRAGASETILTVDERGNTVRTQKLSDWPLERLYRSGAFGKGKDEQEIANQRYDAGERLYSIWFHSQLYPLGSRDYRKPYTGASNDPYSVAPTQERQELQRERWRKAFAVLSQHGIYDRIGRTVHYIVIDEKEPAEVGLIITGRRDKAQARAVAIEFLIEGLDRLRALWGMEA